MTYQISCFLLVFFTSTALAKSDLHTHGSQSHTHDFTEHGASHTHGNLPAATFPAQASSPVAHHARQIFVIKNPTNRPSHKKYGFYSRDSVRILWLNQGRKIKLLDSLSFTDPDGKVWLAPKGSVVDGASIPVPARPFVGGPYTGKYVMASIIHDVACDQEKEPWRAVHKVFHYAMLTSGVEESKAALMYRAVYQGGPRWGKDAEKRLTNEQLERYLVGDEEYEKLATERQEDIMLLTNNVENFSGYAFYLGGRTKPLPEDKKPKENKNKKGQEEKTTTDIVAGVVLKKNDFTAYAEVSDKGKLGYGVRWELNGNNASSSGKASDLFSNSNSPKFDPSVSARALPPNTPSSPSPP